MLVQHREIIKIPAAGDMKHTVRLQEGGRINLTLAGDKRLLAKIRIEAVFTRENNRKKQLFRFGTTRGCYTQSANTLRLGKNTGEQNILPGRYTLEIKSSGFYPVRQSFVIEKNKATHIDMTLQLVDQDK